jgi:chemotaxis protein methyltransferase CheR
MVVTSALAGLSDSDLASLALVSGLPLAAYRRSHVQGCVARALLRLGVPDVAGLGDLLRRDPAARAGFRRSLLVPVTRMFRDEAEFRLLEQVVLPELLAARRQLQVWSAGCANGAELRSVGSLLEQAGAAAGAVLVGTDVLVEALEQAAAGAASRPEETQASFRFERRDLVLDEPPPPSRRFDLVLCRNVAIYLEPDVQAAVHAKLVSALRAGGFLMLGASETLLRPERLALEPVSRHVFRKVGS